MGKTRAGLRMLLTVRGPCTLQVRFIHQTGARPMFNALETVQVVKLDSIHSIRVHINLEGISCEREDKPS